MDASQQEFSRLQAEFELFRLMIDGVRDYAIFMLDPLGHITTWNSGAERIKGYRAEEIIGKHFSQFYPQEDVAAGKPQRELLIARQQGKYEEEGWRLRKDGGTFWANVLITALFDAAGELRGFSKVTRDVTQRKEAERILLESKEQAERLAREAEQARDAAEHANRAKEQFLAVLSHELRTPLTPILATVSLVERRPDLPEELRVEIGTLRRNVELEAKLVDDLLDMTRIARGKLSLHAEVVDGHDLVRLSLQLVQKEIEAKGLDLLLSLRAKHHELWADPTRLQQVLANLLQNAVKFTPEGGNITVRTSNDGDKLNLVVMDTGIGIEPDVLPRLFNPFEQGERTVTRKYGGLGLGLSICKSIVEMHHGTLTAASEGTGTGAKFTVTLEALPVLAERGASVMSPAIDQPDRIPSITAAQHADRTGGRILYVEDHDDTRRVMGTLLKSLGYTVKTAATVAEAMKIAEREEIDLLVSDIGLPDGSGHDVMRHLKPRGIKGIALSGFGQQEDVARSAEAGFETHLIKPVNLQTLEGAVRRCTASDS
ncbi:MAG TPA: ATP-binding protein [Tepidisphaeraceae bacterium]|nr:ATP-binding protein [Tepidisphaeraceae bacterium]